MHCHVVVPDLFWPRTDQSEVYQDLRLPSLELLLARGRRSVSEVGGYSKWLAAQFGISGEDPPVAPYRLIGDGIEPGEARWLCADPVHLQAGIDRVSLTTAGLDIDAEEANELIDALNRHFATEELQLIAPDAERWYMRARDEDLVTTGIEAVQGFIVDDTLPRGGAGARWRTRLTEAQMILHDHHVNRAREARGAAPINGIWVWGGGVRRPLASRRGERWYADDALARGFARAADALAASVPDTVRDEHIAREGVRWFIPRVATAPARRGDVNGWRAALQGLERGWFAPLTGLLKRGTIGMVSVHAVSSVATLSSEVTRSDLRHLWHRPRALPSYLGGAS